MTDFARLVLDADTRGLRKASDALKDVNSEAGKAAGAVDKNTSRMTSSFSRFAKIGVAALATAVVGLAASFAKATWDSIRFADEMFKTSQKIGVSVEELSKLKHVADMSGVSFDSMQGSIRRLSLNMAQAAQGVGEGQRAFQRLGISVKDADGRLKSSTAIMAEVADRFAAMEDGAEKTALSMQVFGRAGADLIPMLNAGSDAMNRTMREAEELGIVLDEKTGRRAEAFRDNLERLKKIFSGLALAISADMLPYLLQFSNWLVDNQGKIREKALAMVEYGKKGIAAFKQIIDWARDARDWLVRIANATNLVISPMRTIYNIFSSIRGGGGGAAASGGGSFRSPFDIMRDELGGIQRQARISQFVMGDFGDAAVSAGGRGARALKAVNDNLDEANPKATELQRLLDRLFPERAQARRFSEELELINEQLAEGEERAAALLKLTKEFYAPSSAMQSMIDRAFPDRARFAEYESGIAMINAELAKGEHSALSFADALMIAENLEQDFVRASRAQSEFGRQTEVVTARIAKSWHDMANDTIAALDRITGAIRGGGFLNILSAVIGMGMQLGSIGAFGKTVAARLNAPAGVGGGLVAMPPELIGTARDPNHIPLPMPRANGGPVMPGKRYLVGEHRPEMFVPNTAGRIEPRVGGATRIEVIPSPYFDVRVQQNIGAAAPGIAEAGAIGGAKRMAHAQSRRWA